MALISEIKKKTAGKSNNFIEWLIDFLTAFSLEVR